MKVATLLALSTSAYGLAFDGPLPTPVTDLVYAALTGFSPKPTQAARAVPDLFRRQKNDPAVCGFLNGDSDFPVSCTASSSCIFSASSKWFGCCASSSCAPMTRCIASSAVSSCLNDSSCYNDPAAMACSAASAPACINMFAKVADGTMSHWVCGASATSVQVLASTSKASGPPSKATDGSAIVQNGGAKTSVGAGAMSMPSNVAAASASATAVRSTGAGAMHTAGAVVGVAGGIVGAFAVFL
ncbi:hypothetical protein DE146DRAFT_644108 [Phaeosphaeria sp. MPI-PUGE-AT-0046c]|nr:hypothetical protein DE146DRAFT_644108 [Phaeosphaeria sp. MPI-PUGE-AT-0046c]